MRRETHALLNPPSSLILEAELLSNAPDLIALVATEPLLHLAQAYLSAPFCCHSHH